MVSTLDRRCSDADGMCSRRKKNPWFADVGSSGYLSGVKTESNSLFGDSALRYSSSWRLVMWQWRGVRWTWGEMASSSGKRLGERNIQHPSWRRRNGDEGIRAKLMLIFYSGSERSLLSNTVITSLVRGERKRDSSLCQGREWITGLNWVVTSEGVVLTLQRDEMEEDGWKKRSEVLIKPFVFISLLPYPQAGSSHRPTLR